MRVPVIRPRRRRRGESGAIALLAGMLALVVVVAAAFTVDFGQSYTSKRQLQTAADAASLAAAAYYYDKSGNCAALSGNGAWTTASRAVAQTYLDNNRPGNNVENYAVGCNAGRLTVDVTVAGTTDVGLGKLVFGSSTLSTRRAAQAMLIAPTSTHGLRPYMVCSEFVPSVIPSGQTQVNFPATSDTTGNCPHSSGNWFTLDCPHIGNGQNGNPGLADATEFGCDSAHGVSIVDPQDASSMANLTTSLLAACPGSVNFPDYDPDCLSANPGNLSANGVITAWDRLIARRSPVVFPIFCGKANCDPAGFKDVGGNNTLYPVYRLAGAQVCGYHWGNKDSGTYSNLGNPSDPCNGANAAPGTNQDNYLILVFTRVQESGGLEDADCALAAACDSGLRSVRLTK